MPENWYPSENIKEEVIQNIKKGGYAELYFNNDVNVDYHYYKGNFLETRISIKSKELSNLDFSVGDYIDFKDNPITKGVNFKIREPKGWRVEYGGTPNSVISFDYNGNTYSIIIKDIHTFISRSQAKKMLSDNNYVNVIINQSFSFLDKPEVINSRVITIDTYPTIEVICKGNMAQMGYNLKMMFKYWMVFYEDKIIIVGCGGQEGREFETLKSFYDSITNSIIFPDRFN